MLAQTTGCMAGVPCMQVILLSVPVGVGKPLCKAMPPMLDSAFVREMGIVLRPLDRSAALPRVPSFRDHVLPYELRAVEAALSAAVLSWEAETAALEHRILPCLRALLQKVRACAQGFQGLPLASGADSWHLLRARFRTGRHRPPTAQIRPGGGKRVP